MLKNKAIRMLELPPICLKVESFTEEKQQQHQKEQQPELPFKYQYKLKTELCRNIVSSGQCSYGKECRFAHSLSEMRGVTVRAKVEAGIINDPSTFRTRPCFDFISSGACPYGDRCVDLHDPRVANTSVKPWLGCKQFNGGDEDDDANGIANVDVHIDGSRETKRAMIHQGECFGPNTLGMLSSYASFKTAVCNYLSKDWMTLVMKSDFLPFLTITKIMLDARERKTFPFNPSHVVYDRPCMILQEKLFYVPAAAGHHLQDHSTYYCSSCHAAGGPSAPKPAFVLEIFDKADLAVYLSRHGPGYTVKATEIAFGPPGSTLALDHPAIWFDIPQDATKKADVSTVKILTSRMKNRAGKRRETLVSLRRLLTEKGLLRWGPFFTYYSDRKDMRQLIVETINLKISELELLAGTWPLLGSNHMASARISTIVEDDHLELRFNAIKDEHLRYGWPVNEGRDVSNLDIPAPHADSSYSIASTPSSDYDFARRIYSSFSSTINTNATVTVYHRDDNEDSDDRTNNPIAVVIDEGTVVVNGKDGRSSLQYQDNRPRVFCELPRSRMFSCYKTYVPKKSANAPVCCYDTSCIYDSRPAVLPKIFSRSTRRGPLFPKSFIDDWEKVKTAVMRKEAARTSSSSKKQTR